MAKFIYTGKTIQNTKIKGSLEAADENAFLASARLRGIFLISWRRQEESEKSVYKLKALELSDFARQVYSMLSSGIPIFGAVGIMKERDLPKKIKEVYEKLYLTIQNGNTLATALELSGGSFPLLMINMFKAGEASGQLDKTALKMADYYEREHKLYGKVKNAMTYPIILLIITVIVVMLLFTVILPSFFDLFTDMDLPAITKVVLAISVFMSSNWYAVLVGIFILVAVLSLVFKLPGPSLWLDKLKLGIPIAGKLLRTIYTARFARTLSSLYSSGLTMLDAVSISASIIGNKYVASQFGECMNKIRSGDALSSAIIEVKGLDTKLSSTIYVGEETGRLDSMLNSIADNFDFEAENATSRLVTLIEPVMIVIMAVVIGSIMLSVMLPIMTMYQNVG